MRRKKRRSVRNVLGSGKEVRLAISGSRSGGF
jgi:hypothetical protein